MSEALQPAARRASRGRYLAVGHVTVDVMTDGERRPGGTVLYSAVQAARLGFDATIITRGVRREIEALLGPYRGELELIVQDAPETTTLATEGTGGRRRQRVLAWAGPLAPGTLPDAELLHLAPIAAELAAPIHGRWGFVGLTPQGFARRWAPPDNEIEPGVADPALLGLAGRCDAVVLSEGERDACASLLACALAGGARVAITAGPDAAELLDGDGGREQAAFAPIAEPADDLGAGDVYAAAFFIRLASGGDTATAARYAHAAAELRMLGVGPDAIAASPRIDARVAELAPPRR